MNKITINISYDFRTDSKGRDPDKFSSTLKEFHKKLWSRNLPSGELFELNDNINGAYLYHNSLIGEFFLSSDSIIPTFSKRKRLSYIINEIPPEDIKKFMTLAYTMWGMMLFPSNKVDSKPTINADRGFNRKIADRMDLTLECIRKHYIGETSPMSDTLQRYDDFFKIFDNFKWYVDFFLLNDLVKEDYSNIKFFLPSNNFQLPSVPKTIEEYNQYKNNTIEFINARNKRIMNLQ